MSHIKKCFPLIFLFGISVPTLAQPPGPGGPSGPEESAPESMSEADCVVAKTGDFAIGQDLSLCVFLAEACGSDPLHQTTAFLPCPEPICACDAGDCNGHAGEPLSPVPDDGGTPAVPGTPEPIALKFKACKQEMPWVVPLASRLIQDTEGQITTFGVGDFKVKYLKALRLQAPGGTQYFALFKIFRSDNDDDVGDDFETSDGYIGIRVGTPSGQPAGGYLDLNSNSTTDFQKLDKFTPTDPNGTGYVREAGARLPIASSDDDEGTWFHLYGTVL